MFVPQKKFGPQKNFCPQEIFGPWKIFGPQILTKLYVWKKNFGSEINFGYEKIWVQRIVGPFKLAQLHPLSYSYWIYLCTNFQTSGITD